MPSTHKAIADAVVSVLEGVSGAPDTVEFRKTDALFGGETKPAVIVTLGEANEMMAVSGAGTATDQGDLIKEYWIKVSIYRTCLADITNDLALSPDYVHAAQQALNKTTLSGVSAVVGTKLVRHDAWEHQPFGEAHEKSEFHMIFLASETRLGN
jgi:hypothetical protein